MASNWMHTHEEQEVWDTLYTCYYFDTKNLSILDLTLGSIIICNSVDENMKFASISRLRFMLCANFCVQMQLQEHNLRILRT